MTQPKLCRLCTKSKKTNNLSDLFDKNQNYLTMIQQTTGIFLSNVESLPRYVCHLCLQDLKSAHEFRERCIKAQHYFNSVGLLPRENSNEDLQIKDESETKGMPEIEIKDELLNEGIHLQEFDFVKTEITNIFSDSQTFGINGCSSNDASEEAPSAFKNTPEDSQKSLKKSDAEDKVKCFARIEDKKLELKTLKLRAKEYESKRQTSYKKKSTFICDQCGSAFAFRSNFMAHQRRHTGEKLYQCEVCPEKFFSNAELELHVRKHTGEKPFACNYCDRRFIKNSIRVNHEKTHTNERPFACNQCSKTFTNSFILKNHMVVHTGIRKFGCYLCDKWFGQKPHLKTHYKSMMHKQNEEKVQQNSNTFLVGNLDSTKGRSVVVHKD